MTHIHSRARDKVNRQKLDLEEVESKAPPVNLVKVINKDPRKSRVTRKSSESLQMTIS